MARDQDDAIADFAAHVAGTGFDDIPAAAIHKAKVFILDTLGVGIVGSEGPWVDQLIACAAGWGAGEDAQVWSHGTRLPAPSAALVNAYQAHNSEFDAVHEGAVLHPMASILGAVLAHAGRRPGIDGRTLLAAAVLGADVSCSIGLGATTGLTFFRPATAGAFGAVAALGKVDGADADTLHNAFGIVLGQIGGTMQAHTEGSMMLGMQLGFCTRAAVMAHDMAARGLAGPRQVLEGQFGYYALFEGGHDLGAVRAGLGSKWRITEISHKPFPAGRATHGVIDALLTLRERHQIAAERVLRVTAQVTPLVHHLCGRPDMDEPSVNYARLCIPYTGAVALIEGGVGVADFAPKRLNDPAVHALARRIDVVRADNPDPNALAPIDVRVCLDDGTEHAITVNTAIGHPDNPLSEARHLDKFRRNWESGTARLGADKRRRLEAMIGDLEKVTDCAEIVEQMCP